MHSSFVEKLLLFSSPAGSPIKNQVSGPEGRQIPSQKSFFVLSLLPDKSVLVRIIAKIATTVIPIFSDVFIGFLLNYFFRAGERNRTAILTLARLHKNHYTTPALRPALRGSVCRGKESDLRPQLFQSCALPLSYHGIYLFYHIVGAIGFAQSFDWASGRMTRRTHFF